jgi:tetratricopeptide (TPR) repeat protein
VVFEDPALGKQAGRFVWLAMDSEKEQNRAFLDGHPVGNWPTLMVLDENGAPLLRWAGLATAAQLGALLDDGLRAKSGSDALARADKLAATGKPADAARAYRDALPSVPADRRPRVVEALVLELLVGEAHADCFHTALDWVDKLERGSSFSQVAWYGLDCAVSGQVPDRKPGMAKLMKAVAEGIQLPSVLAADKNDAWDALIAAYEDLGDKAGAKREAAAQLAFCEREAAHAASAEARAAFVSHQLSAAMTLGEPARAIPALEASERDLPKDYNAPARLANALRAAGKLDQALAASDRALKLAYGPRRIKLYDARADIQLDRHDAAGARDSLGQALAIAATLPADKRAHETARLKKKLDGIR